MSLYRPKAFAVDDPAELLRFMHAYPFATLVTYGNEILTSHIPVLAFEREDRVVIAGHVARANPQWKATDTHVRAAVLFRGVSHYISPNWYPSKAENGRAVPTFDYEVVEARGTIRFFDDAAALRELVDTLSIEHENTVGGAWRITDAPEEYIEANLRAIVGFDVIVDELAGAYKLSQNHPQANRDGAAQGLDALGTPQARATAERIRAAGER